ncbi:MAG: uracil-DNA glycosylase [bacterium]
MDKKTEQLRKMRDSIVDCQKCPLYKTRILPVIGQGNHNAKAIFIGEAPGATEDKTGVPFCGAAGRILSELLESIDCKREDIYIANILKCRPPTNRNPLQNEIDACVGYLEEQIKIIQPKVICPMGNYAVNFILRNFGLGDEIQGISKIHGKLFESDTELGKLKIAPLYHPAVSVYNANMKDVLKKDFQLLKGLIS